MRTLWHIFSITTISLLAWPSGYVQAWQEHPLPTPEIHAVTETVPPDGEIIHVTSDDDTGLVWQLVSMRTVQTSSSFYIFAELLNVDGSSLRPGQLEVELTMRQEQKTLYLQPRNPKSSAGESIFYQNAVEYANSSESRPSQKSVAPWEAKIVGVSSHLPDEDNSVILDALWTETEADLKGSDAERVYGAWTFEVVRDSNGTFAGGCYGPLTGPDIPEDESIATTTFLGQAVPICGFTQVGVAASEELGYDGPFTTESAFFQEYEWWSDWSDDSTWDKARLFLVQRTGWEVNVIGMSVTIIGTLAAHFTALSRQRRRTADRERRAPRPAASR